ncbi:hypothetical protein ACO0QE_004601 [Hanseniaspora vineae]
MTNSTTANTTSSNTAKSINTNEKNLQLINNSAPERYNPPVDGQPTAPMKLASDNTNTSNSATTGVASTVSKHIPSQTNQSFTQKLYTMLSDESLKDLIWWSQSKDSFMIKPNEKFSKALSIYFKHTNVASFVRQLNMYGYFRKGDLENLKKIKRRASKNTVTHVATSTTIRNGSSGVTGPSGQTATTTTTTTAHGRIAESSGAPPTRMHPLGYNPPLGHNSAVNNYTINHRNSYPGEATATGTGNTIRSAAPHTQGMHATASQTNFNPKPLYSDTSDVRSSSLNNLPAALAFSNNNTFSSNTSNNSNITSNYNKNSLHNSTLINNQFANSLHRSSVTSVSSMPNVCNPHINSNPPTVPASIDLHLMDSSKPRNNSVPANAHQSINTQLPTPLENYSVQNAQLQQSPASVQRKSLSNPVSESINNMENSKMFQLVIEELQNISADNIQMLELFQYYLNEKRNQSVPQSSSSADRSNALLNDLQNFKTNIANRSSKIIELLKNKNMAYLQVNNNNLINNNTVSTLSNNVIGGNSEMVKSEQIGSTVRMYPNVPATAKTPPPQSSLTSSSFTGLPGQMQGNSSLRNMSVVDPLQPLPSQQVQPYQPQLQVQQVQQVQQTQQILPGQQAQQVQPLQQGIPRATSQPQHYVPSNASMSPNNNNQPHQPQQQHPQQQPQQPQQQPQQQQQQTKNEPMAYKPYYPFGIVPAGAGVPQNEEQQKQQSHVQSYQPQLQHQEYVTPQQSQPVVHYTPSNNSNQSVAASQSQQQTPFFGRTNSIPGNKMRISVSSSATTMSSSNDFHNNHNTSNNDNSAGNGNESRVSVSSLPLTMGTSTSFLPNHQYIQMPSTQAIMNINNASSRKNSANNAAGSYALPGLSQPNTSMQSVPQHNVAHSNVSLPGLPRLNSSVSVSSSSTLLNAGNMQHKPSISGSNSQSKSDLYSLLNTRNDSSNTESAEQQHQLLQKLNNTSAQATIGMKRTYSETYGSRAHSNNIDPKTPAPL